MCALYLSNKIIKVSLKGVLKGIAKTDEIILEITDNEIELKELINNLSNKLGTEFKNRILNEQNDISSDILIEYNGKVFPAWLNERKIIKKGDSLTIFSFVHGG
jgi:sulfur carrier protein ThiS